MMQRIVFLFFTGIFIFTSTVSMVGADEVKSILKIENGPGRSDTVTQSIKITQDMKDWIGTHFDRKVKGEYLSVSEIEAQKGRFFLKVLSSNGKVLRKRVMKSGAEAKEILKKISDGDLLINYIDKHSGGINNTRAYNNNRNGTVGTGQKLSKPEEINKTHNLVPSTNGLSKALSATFTDEQTLPVTGTWTGKYICGQGPTGLTLTISGDNKSNLRARFRFYGLPQNPSVPDGEFELHGTFYQATGDIYFLPTQWIKRPAGFQMFGMKGLLDRGGQRITGTIQYPQCGKFNVSRVGERPGKRTSSIGYSRNPVREVQDSLNQLGYDAYSTAEGTVNWEKIEREMIKGKKFFPVPGLENKGGINGIWRGEYGCSPKKYFMRLMLERNNTMLTGILVFGPGLKANIDCGAFSVTGEISNDGSEFKISPKKWIYKGRRIRDSFGLQGHFNVDVETIDGKVLAAKECSSFSARRLIIPNNRINPDGLLIKFSDNLARYSQTGIPEADCAKYLRWNMSGEEIKVDRHRFNLLIKDFDGMRTFLGKDFYQFDVQDIQKMENLSIACVGILRKSMDLEIIELLRRPNASYRCGAPPVLIERDLSKWIITEQLLYANKDAHIFASRQLRNFKVMDVERKNLSAVDQSIKEVENSEGQFAYMGKKEKEDHKTKLLAFRSEFEKSVNARELQTAVANLGEFEQTIDGLMKLEAFWRKEKNTLSQHGGQDSVQHFDTAFKQEAEPRVNTLLTKVFLENTQVLLALSDATYDDIDKFKDMRDKVSKIIKFSDQHGLPKAPALEQSYQNYKKAYSNSYNDMIDRSSDSLVEWIEAHPPEEAAVEELKAFSLDTFGVQWNQIPEPYAHIKDAINREMVDFQDVLDAIEAEKQAEKQAAIAARKITTECDRLAAHPSDPSKVEEPFGPEYPGAIYLNAIYRGDHKQIAEYDHMFIEALINLLKPLDDSPHMRLMLLLSPPGTVNFGDSIRQDPVSSMLTPLLGFFAVSYEHFYPQCMDSNPVIFKKTVQWDNVVTNGFGTELYRYPSATQTDWYRINQRHAAAFRWLGGDTSSPESIEIFSLMWGNLIPQDMKKALTFCNDTMSGLRRAMMENSCDSPLIQRLDKNMVEIFAAKAEPKNFRLFLATAESYAERLADFYINTYVLPQQPNDVQAIYTEMHNNGTSMQDAISAIIGSVCGGCFDQLTVRLHGIDTVHDGIEKMESIQITAAATVEDLAERWSRYKLHYPKPVDHYVDMLQTKITDYKADGLSEQRACVRSAVDLLGERDRDRGVSERMIPDFDKDPGRYNYHAFLRETSLRTAIFDKQEAAFDAQDHQNLSRPGAAQPDGNSMALRDYSKNIGQYDYFTAREEVHSKVR